MDKVVAFFKYFMPSWEKNSGFRELLLFLSFLVFYKFSRFVAIGDAATAFENAYKVIELEKLMGIYYEIPIQKWFLERPNLILFLNEIYIRVHVPSTILFFVWLWRYYKPDYLWIRNGFLIANVITLFFFIGYPCAPPRMLNELGFVDTLLELSGINLYEGVKSKLFNQYAAVPSMHFGYSLFFAIGAWLYSKNFLVRYGLILYPLLVLTVIVATGNHFFVDAILGGIIAMIPYPIMKWMEGKWPIWEKRFRGPVWAAQPASERRNQLL